MNLSQAWMLSAVTLLSSLTSSSDAFMITSPSRSANQNFIQLDAGGGFGGGFGSSKSKAKNKKSRNKKGNLIATLNDEPSKKSKKKQQRGMTYVKSEQDALLQSLASNASLSPIGKAVDESPLKTLSPEDIDPFWELIPSLIQSKFPNAKNEELERVAGFVSHALDPNLPLEQDIIDEPWRPHDDIHAYMPNLSETKPFHDPMQLELCRKLCENIEVIEQEYEALLDDMINGKDKKDRFQSVTSMNYESGWKTLVLFYNGHRIKDFPYHLCPVTTEIMESVPLAGRIAGFNRQQPKSGIPLHSDGNNMWLTTQLGVKIPDGEQAYIRVGPETKHWKRGECLLYDTTYEHETMNDHESQERVVLHVDFFNTLSMTPLEIDIMRYIYTMREEFMKAEGVAKVGSQIL
jgi:aspartyl/asparaginyl beta-hydroxylase (cupin superfamily)